jgi:ribosomal protein S18 acetylase RimI-like enzyme
MIRIIRATSSFEIETARALFLEYAAALDFDLCFQGFDDELASLPGAYAPPNGALLLAVDGDAAIGCVALRPLDWPLIAELKRLYVRPEGRGREAGRMLAVQALATARDIGYQRVRLDTVPGMTAAQKLYEALGFRAIDAYRPNPIAGAKYLEWVDSE